MPITPEYLAKPGTEHAHQVALFCWCAMNKHRFPELEWYYAIPNGGDRAPAVAARLKSEGVKSGVSDTCLPVSRRGYHSLYIEMKKPVEGQESAKQREFGEFLLANGSYYAVCFGWEEAVRVLEWYLGE